MSNLGLKGYFNVVKKNADGSIIEQYDFENLILDVGLDLIGFHDIYTLQYCHVGTGNAEPDVKDTQLANHLSRVLFSSESRRFDLTNDEKYLNITRKYVFPQNIAVGNLSEIGISHSDNRANGLFCRTLIKDAKGRPTVISKLADEILEVFYTLRITIYHQDITGTALIAGEEYDYICRPALLGDSSQYQGAVSRGGLVSITGHPSADGSSEDTAYLAYETGTYYRYTSKHISLAGANFPIRSVLYVGIFRLRWQCQFSKKSDGSAIPKSSKNTVTLKFKTSWRRA